MKVQNDQQRFVPPIMQAFRSAFRERDSGKELDIRSAADERIIPGRRTSPRNAVSETVLRQELADDLAALLNTVNLASIEDLRGLEEVRRSILNYGVDDLASISTESETMERLEGKLREVLEFCEARLVRGTVAVVRESAIDEINTKVAFHINAEMYASPSNVSVEFVADLDAYSGKLGVKRS